jgi:hypothetical protein
MAMAFNKDAANSELSKFSRSAFTALSSGAADKYKNNQEEVVSVFLEKNLRNITKKTAIALPEHLVIEAIKRETGFSGDISFIFSYSSAEDKTLLALISSSLNECLTNLKCNLNIIGHIPSKQEAVKIVKELPATIIQHGKT